MKHASYIGYLISLALVCSTAACGSSPPPPVVASPDSQARDWLVEGQRLAGLGQGLRAEEYLRAAWEAGAPATETAPLLIEICVEAGRLRSALLYVARLRREEPNNPQVVQLSASLYLALGQDEHASADVSELERLAPDYPQGIYFLGEYHLFHGEADRAIPYFERYLAKWPQAVQAAWVRHLLEESQRKLIPVAAGIDVEATVFEPMKALEPRNEAEVRVDQGGV